MIQTRCGGLFDQEVGYDPNLGSKGSKGVQARGYISHWLSA